MTITRHRFAAHGPGKALGRVSGLLNDLDAGHGEARTRVQAMAGSPAVLTGYLDFSRATKRAGLDRRLGVQISIAIQTTRGCNAC